MAYRNVPATIRLPAPELSVKSTSPLERHRADLTPRSEAATLAHERASPVAAPVPQAVLP
jgi:hypothetical protein